MTLYDEYRREHPINPEPSEFRDIVEAEVRRALEWMRGRKWISAPSSFPEPVPCDQLEYGKEYMMTIPIIKCHDDYVTFRGVTRLYLFDLENPTFRKVE